MHGPVCHVDELQEADGLLHALRGALIYGLEDVLDDGFVAEEGEGPLQHDGDPSAYLLSEGVMLRKRPVVDGLDLRVPAAFGAGLPFERQVYVSAGAAAVDVVEYASGVGCVFGAAPQHVQDDALSGTAPPDETDDLPGLEGGAEVVEDDFAVELLAHVLYRD